MLSISAASPTKSPRNRHGFAHLDRRHHLQLQRHLPAPASWPAAGQWHRLCRLWQLLRFCRQSFPRLAARLVHRITYPTSGQPASRYATFPGNILPFLDLDVRLRPGCRRLRQHRIRHGNSDYSGTTYDGVSNIQESVVKVSSNLATVLDLFTPMDQASLDQTDADFGSGGALVLPDQPGSTPHLAVAAGKAGTLFLMNEDQLGGYSTTKNNVLGSYNVGHCWCGHSYFVAPRRTRPRRYQRRTVSPTRF